MSDGRSLNGKFVLFSGFFFSPSFLCAASQFLRSSRYIGLRDSFRGTRAECLNLSFLLYRSSAEGRIPDVTVAKDFSYFHTAN